MIDRKLASPQRIPQLPLCESRLDEPGQPRIGSDRCSRGDRARLSVQLDSLPKLVMQVVEDRPDNASDDKYNCEDMDRNLTANKVKTW